MPNDKDDDVIKNPARKQQSLAEPYEPEYKRLKKEPLPYDILTSHKIPAPIVQIHQRPVAPELNFKSTVEKVNSVAKESFSSVDGKDFDQNGDDVSVNNGFIDNNDEIDLGFYSGKEPTSSTDKKSSLIKEVSASSPKKSTEEAGIPEIGEFILMIFGKIIMIGKMNLIENKVQSILYGEDDEFGNQLIKLDDIVVLKRMQIKAGVFLAE